MHLPKNFSTFAKNFSVLGRIIIVYLNTSATRFFVRVIFPRRILVRLNMSTKVLEQPEADRRQQVDN